MQAKEKTILVENEETHAVEEVADLFATDFFGAGNPVAENVSIDELPEIEELVSEEAETVVVYQPAKWFSALPKITRREADVSNDLTFFPEGFAEEILTKSAEILARYVARPKAEISFQQLETRENSWENLLLEVSDESHIFHTLALEPQNIFAIGTVNSSFWLALIEALLGGAGKQIETLRNLSPTELVIAEFLTLGILSELNQQLGENSIRLANLNRVAPKSLKNETRGAEIRLALRFGKIESLARFFFPQDFLQNLKTEKQWFSVETSWFKIRRLTEKIETRLILGRTEIDSTNFAFLQAGDVVLLENPELGWLNGKTARLQIGSGQNVGLLGKVHLTQKNNSENEGLLLTLQEISSEKASDEIVRIRMEENLLETDETDNLAVLENIMLGLRVELAGRKMSLEELRRLRVGQIIELGCKPTDAVELVTEKDGKPVAIGELLEIEGNLGVKLTKVFV